MFKFDVRDRGRGGEESWRRVWERGEDTEEGAVAWDEDHDGGDEREDARSMWEAELAAIWESEELWRRRGLFEVGEDMGNGPEQPVMG